MSYSLVVMLELNDVSEIQYKEIMIIGDIQKSDGLCTNCFHHMIKTHI